ncbi:hypothetical protein JYU34_014441 [Plutella xylostella]|uniref:Protein kinase domain-containing protein n=1 Tax=Plutella xylostella TaxID=51655 RepID=A0ABQ7Q8P4_PLUXY|nr:hypothetical protein JYU34_014441 [Plutella xylostella]
MADSHGKSRSKKSWKHKHKDDKKYRSTRTSSHSRHYLNDECEVKTPPLPTNDKKALEDLLKKREDLKKELSKINNSNDTVHSKQKDEINNIDSDNTKDKVDNSRKRHAENEKSKVNKTEPKPAVPDVETLDSDDEQNIIEQRRKLRKKLIEKLISNNKNIATDNNGKEKNHSNNKEVTNSKSLVTNMQNNNDNTTDMFSEKDEFNIFNTAPDNVTQENTNNTQLSDNWDDAEGYYIMRVGDVLNSRYTVKNILGQGMFANVVHAIDKVKGNCDVAIKIARNNDMMYRNAIKEISMLKEINNADPDNKHHCVRLLRHFIHKGHLCIVLESLSMDLRSVLKKYGKSNGLNMKAIISYSRQLLIALRHLKNVGIVHADVKPDNILVNEKKNILKLCDFGSAEKVNENDLKPYLVSRFYRAPEIILGIPYGHGIDLWSAGCTMYETATGRIMFVGGSNNKMLKCFMDVKGKIPNKMIKKGKFKDQHFNYNNNFLLHKKDEVTGRDKVAEMCITNPTRNLQEELKKYCKNLEAKDEKKLVQLKDLLDKVLMLDPNQRPSIVDCLKHPFLQDEA